MKIPSPTKLTIADLDRFPDDGNRYELIDGELFVSAAPFEPHQKVLKRLFRSLDRFAEEQGLGVVYFAPLDVYLSLPGATGQTRVEPDLLFVAKASMDIVREAVFGPPDLVVEVLSESTARADLFEKRDAYRSAGVAEYWVANPYDRTIIVHRFAGGGAPLVLSNVDRLTTPLLPGFELPVSSIFA